MAMDDIINPIRTAMNGNAQAMSEVSRLKLQDSLRAAAESLETPHDTMLRLFNSVSNLLLDNIPENSGSV